MKVTICFIVIFLLSMLNAQTIDLGGTVTNKAGKAIAGAEVFLKHAALKDTTDINGFFRIRKFSSGIKNIHIQPVHSSDRGVIEIFDLKGQMFCKQQILSGEEIIIKGLHDGVFLARTTIHGQKQCFQFNISQLQKNNVTRLQFPLYELRAENGLRLAASSAYDTLQVTKSSYQTALIKVNSFIDTTLIITLDSGTASQPSEGCGKSFTRPDPSVKQTLSVSGANRTYQVYVPSNYSPEKPLPLIFALHGGGGSAASARNDFKLEAATNNGAIIVYPESPFWNYGSGTDMAFFDALIKDIKSKFCIESNKVYATGFSLGGIFVNGIGCLHGGKDVRGIIPVAGSGPNPNMGPASESDIACPSGTPAGDVAVLIIHGTTDGNALYKYGQWEANYWSKHNGCSTTTISGSAPFDECKIYQGCKAPVYFYTHSGGHMVPGNAGAMIWEFIKMMD